LSNIPVAVTLLALAPKTMHQLYFVNPPKEPREVRSCHCHNILSLSNIPAAVILLALAPKTMLQLSFVNPPKEPRKVTSCHCLTSLRPWFYLPWPQKQCYNYPLSILPRNQGKFRSSPCHSILSLFNILAAVTLLALAPKTMQQLYFVTKEPREV
jgi:hypothetical protein